MQWHLRFPKAARLEILLKPGSMSVAREALHIESGWKLEERSQGTLAMAVFTKK